MPVNKRMGVVLAKGRVTGDAGSAQQRGFAEQGLDQVHHQRSRGVVPVERRVELDQVERGKVSPVK
jgi:hypothetical protein